MQKNELSVATVVSDLKEDLKDVVMASNPELLITLVQCEALFHLGNSIRAAAGILANAYMHVGKHGG